MVVDEEEFLAGLDILLGLGDFKLNNPEDIIKARDYVISLREGKIRSLDWIK